MMMPWTRALTAALLAAVPATASAQATGAAADPSAPPLGQFGPFSLRPALILRDVGYDSNIFNEAEGVHEDFTATIGARLEVEMNLPRLQGKYTTSYEYVHFASAASERGSNRGVEGQLDVPLGRLRPYVAAGISDSHDRFTAEIDRRARRQQSHLESGLRAALSSRTSAHAAFRRGVMDFADDEQFRDVNLASELDGRSDSVRLGAEMALTPLTTVSLHGERVEDRFDTASDRDANWFRLSAAAVLNPLALISGRASIGVRAFRPLDSGLRSFTGLTAAVAVGYTFPDETRLSVALDRDLRYSYSRLTPYYVATGGRLTIARQLIGRIDGQVFGGAERLAYEAREGLEPPAGADTLRIVGGGVGYRVGNGSRLELKIDHTDRSSPVHDREYARVRVYTTVSYGF